MIQIQNISKSYGTRVLFNDLSLVIPSGSKVGFVGRNGTGKSTLFKIIMNEESYENGDIVIPKNYRIGTLRQHLEFTHNTVREECASVLEPGMEHEVYRVEKILFGLGFTQEDLDKKPSSFSGGYQIRLNLVKLLVTEPNMLLLDEPTNYLDIISLRWLASFIRSFEGEVILITHDRDFMDSVSTHTMGLQRQQISIIKGNTYKYYALQKQDDELYLKTKQNHDKKRAELEEFIARNKARASTAVMAQSKVKELEKMGIMEELITLFSQLSFLLESNKCLAIIGKNGQGKSTLLNVLAGVLSSRTGDIHYHPSTKISHFGQTNIERLNKDLTIVDEIQNANSTLNNVQVRSICGAMMFSGDTADKKISILSGGERSRVMLGKIIATPANLLFLDEPTNHLDMYSIDSLCTALEEFNGTTILVTHSEMLLRKLADQLIIFREGNAEFFDGGYDEFLEKIGWDEEIVPKQKNEKSTSNISKKESKQQKATLIQERSKLTSPIKKEMLICENSIMSLEAKVSLSHQKLLDYSTNGESYALQQLSIEVAHDEKEIEKLFDRLSELEEQLSTLESDYEKKLAAL